MKKPGFFSQCDGWLGSRASVPAFGSILMKTPILIFEGNDVVISETVGDAEVEIEPYDVWTPTYDIFDADGKRLTARVIEVPAINRGWKWLSRLLGFIGLTHFAVQLNEDANASSQEHEVVERLRMYLTSVGIPEHQINHKSMMELIEIVRGFQPPRRRTATDV